MLKNQSNTAILIFIRSEQEEAEVKPFAGRNREPSNRSIAHALNRQVKNVAAKTSLPAIVIPGPRQRGETFGERFANAMQDAFGMGFEKIIATGNDCLGLTPALLLQAASDLQSKSYVFGPATDGGVYLLGMSRQAFDFEKFAALPWQTGQVFDALQVYAGSAAIAILPASIDADDAESLAASLRSMRSFLGLKNVLENLLRRTSRISFFEKKYSPAPVFSHHFLLRAPPLR